MAAKVPYPRQLAANETLDTLTHWKSHVRNYFRRDDNLKNFFARATTWDPAGENYGFEGENAADKADHLEGLLDTIAGFMPGPYLTAFITKQTTSMEDVFQYIWKHYDVQPNPSTFLEFADLTLAKEERYIDLWYRMLYHAEQHLVVAGTNVAGVQVQQTETLSHSHKNLIALNWMKSLNSNLISIVKLEKHKELKEGQQVYTMVNDISKNVDEWLRRHGHNVPVRSKDPVQPVETQVRNLKFEGYSPNNKPRGTGRGQFRGGFRGRPRGRSSSFAGNNQRFQGPRQFCPGCNYLSQELDLDVNYKHYPAECPRKSLFSDYCTLRSSTLTKVM